MTKYFKCQIRIFDPEDFFTKECMKREIEGAMDWMLREGVYVVWEDVKVKEVELEEYEKEDQNGKI